MPEVLNKNLIPISIILAGLLIALSLFLSGGGKIDLSFLNQETATQKMAEKAMEFINKDILAGASEASLVSVSDSGDVYKVRINVGGQEYDSYITKDGKLFFPEGYELTATTTEQEATNSSLSVGNFSISNDELCQEGGKPTVYFFGSAGCPHCVWEHPIVENVVKNFEDFISFHNNMDSDADSEIFSKYSNGSIPTLVLGCKYYRVGSGEQDGETKETQNLTALMCKLTNNQPSDVCESVRDLVEQIK